MNSKLGKKKRNLLIKAATPTASTKHSPSHDNPKSPDQGASRKIYKYISSQLIDNIFSSPELVTLKCSLPKDFNDPYELFLTIDFDEEPDALAFYADAVGELDQLPTTCFSRSPSVIPMWAHYAENHKGFVIEFSESSLAEAFPESHFENVTYSDSPRDGLTDILYRAFKIGKNRYIYLLRLGVYHAAYFTKATCWTYEQERRMVASTKEIRDKSEMLLLDVPVRCVSSIIVGSRCTDQTKQTLLEIAERTDCNYFETRIGRSSANPYFIDTQGTSHIFDGSALVPATSFCPTCLEPIRATATKTQCSWCQINEEMMQDAASRNSYRILDRAGLLESYIQGMDEITFGNRKPNGGG